jgi:hypothetical protein
VDGGEEGISGASSVSSVGAAAAIGAEVDWLSSSGIVLIAEVSIRCWSSCFTVLVRGAGGGVVSGDAAAEICGIAGIEWVAQAAVIMAVSGVAWVALLAAVRDNISIDSLIVWISCVSKSISFQLYCVSDVICLSSICLSFSVVVTFLRDRVKTFRMESFP